LPEHLVPKKHGRTYKVQGDEIGSVFSILTKRKELLEAGGGA
jgi:hypothetical protein